MNALARKVYDVDGDGPNFTDFGGAGPGMTDFCSRDGAVRLKEKIEAYWRDKGQNVTLSLHNVGFHPAIRAARFDVRSDMVNGMPRSGAANMNASAKPAAREKFSGDDVYVDDDVDLDIYAAD